MTFCKLIVAAMAALAIFGGTAEPTFAAETAKITKEHTIAQEATMTDDQLLARAVEYAEALDEAAALHAYATEKADAKAEAAWWKTTALGAEPEKTYAAFHDAFTEAFMKETREVLEAKFVEAARTVEFFRTEAETARQALDIANEVAGDQGEYIRTLQDRADSNAEAVHLLQTELDAARAEIARLKAGQAKTTASAKAAKAKR